ncbi:nucleotidyltransferase family protein [Sporosarcina beigongshangi]|uniref:nucleotidyltransferase family protein n=1 Tax=Sporosarcina beigongshangi TaxID=2782538 RepID=UPI0019394923|nr:nucleotidyltransferase family protein [Sporosarcina beigongshangi]
MKIAGIYLAAGSSSRMGRNKLMLNVGYMTLGSLALDTALRSSLDAIYVITKETDDVGWLPVDMKLNNKCSIVPCLSAHEGQSESLKCGIRRAQANQMDAVLVMLADQPFITVQMLNEMIACMENNPTCKFVASSFDQTIMPPVLLSSVMYPELLALHGDAGAKKLLQGDILQKGHILPCTDQRLVFDVDTPEDYQLLLMDKEKTK